MSRATAFYDEAACYDLLHASDTEAELAAVLELNARHGNGGKAVLEPACGTGRNLEALARRGFAVTGYDVNPKALAFARGRLRPWKTASVLLGDMRSFRRPAAFDLAFNTLGSIRHLLTEADALRHLRATAASLRPGGLYVVGLDLTDYASAQDDEEVWAADGGGVSLRHVMVSLAPEPRRRREVILNFVTVTEAGRERVLESEYALRSYDAGQWRALVAASPFKVAGQGGGLFALTRKT